MLRIKVSLDKPDSRVYSVPLNYAGLLANQVSVILNTGFEFTGLYSISRLFFDKVNVSQTIEHFGRSVDFVVSIFDYQITENILTELFTKKSFFLPEEYKVVYTKLLEPPTFSNMMKFKTLSPITISELQDGKEDFYFPGDRNFEDLLFDKLYQIHLITGGQRLDLSLCKYFQNDRLYKKRYFVGKGKNKKVSCFFQKFTIRAPEELQKILYYAGAGKLTHAGFGCIEVA